MAEEDISNLEIVMAHETYEDFLDSLVTKKDMFYLEDEEVARQLVELGYGSAGEVMKRSDFEAKKAAAELARIAKRNNAGGMCHYGHELNDPFLKALAEREEANRHLKMTSIIFIRTKNTRGREISGYIDYAHRLKTDEFQLIFAGKKRMIPRNTDLSFFNWDTQHCQINASPYYDVDSENVGGLLFKSKLDRKQINVDPKSSSPGDNTTRLRIKSKFYEEVVFYDHITRGKA